MNIKLTQSIGERAHEKDQEVDLRGLFLRKKTMCSWQLLLHKKEQIILAKILSTILLQTDMDFQKLLM